MEVFFADLIRDSKVPRWLRYILVVIACGFVMFLGVMLMWKSPMTVGRVFGGILAVLFLAAAVFLCVQITRSKPRSDKSCPTTEGSPEDDSAEM